MSFPPISFSLMLLVFSVLCFFSIPHASTAYNHVQTYSNGPVNLTDVTTLYHEADVQCNYIKLTVIITDKSALTDALAWNGRGIGEPTSGSMLDADIVTAALP